MNICLDSFALLAWLQGEAGADAVEAALERHRSAEGNECLVSIVNLAEVYYRIHRARKRRVADTFWRQAMENELPFRVVPADAERVLKAARFKALHPVALGDAFAIQAALECNAHLMTGDPEIMSLAGRISLHVVPLAR